MTTAVTLPLPDGRTLDGYLAGPDDGQLLVFHHGTPSSGHLTDELVAAAARKESRLSRGAAPAMATRPACRDVMSRRWRPTPPRCLDHLGAADCVTLGWSGGGPHAIALAALLPERVRGAATIGGVAPYPARGPRLVRRHGRRRTSRSSTPRLPGHDALIPFKER